ncbi:MAG: ribonuclease P protein component [Firmicutes bacterium]|nr:ribonuclease P protein component [Bacillota bacterium]
MCCLHKTTKILSLKKNQDFKKVYSQGKYAADSFFVAYALANDLNQNRIGITVSKKIGCAVVRNRIKRWVKEACRLLLHDGQAIGYDFVIVARTPTAQLTGKGAFWQINNSVRRLFERLEKKLGLPYEVSNNINS